MARESFRALCLALAIAVTLALGRTTASAQEKEGDDKNSEKSISPEIDQATLDVAGRFIKPVRIDKWTPRAHVVGELRVTVDKDGVHALKQGKAAWDVKSPIDRRLLWLGADDKFIYLAAYEMDKDSDPTVPESPLHVRRLHASSGKWADDLPVDTPDAKQAEAIDAVLTGNNRVAVLTTMATKDKAGEEQLGSYRVTCFKLGETKPLWFKTFSSAAKMARPGVFLLWAARAPDKVEPDVVPLSWLGKNILVCAGPVQDLLCLNSEKGNEEWRVPRVWEFTRSFIGPSVWRHFFGRSTDENDNKEKEPAKKEEKRRDRRYAIVGGPIVVPVQAKGDGESNHHAFVAVAKGPAGYSEYLSDCVVYELDSDGKPLGMVNLPRMVQGGRFRVEKNGLIWACQGGAFVKLGLSRDDEGGLGIGPGGSDLLCRVDWYRHLSAEQPEAWLTTNPAGDPTAFGDAFAFRVTVGGYVKDKDGSIYRFPISMIDLKTGADRDLLLSVPFKGKLPEPTENYAGSFKGGWKKHGPYLLAITGLEAEGNRLRVTMGMKDWARVLDFNIDDLREGKGK